MKNGYEGSSLKRTFVRFITPSILSQWVYVLYAIVDGIFVSRGVSEVALSAVNIVTPYVLGLFAVGITLAVGTSTLVAIRLGEDRVDDACRIYTQNLIVGIGLSVLITLCALLNLDRLADLLGATARNKAYVIEYLRGVSPFAFSFIISYYYEMLVKTDGYPQLATLIVLAGSALNIVLDYVLVIVLPYGVFGAAFATGFANGFVILLYLIHFLGKKGLIKLRRFRFDPAVVLHALLNGLSSGITEISSGIIVLLFNHAIVRYLNDSALISYAVVTYMQCLAVYTMVGISQGYQPLIGYHFGGRRLDSCRRLLKYGLVTQALLTAILACICFLAPRPIVTLYLTDIPENAELIRSTVRVFRIFAVSYLFIGVNVVTAGYFLSVEAANCANVISALRGAVLLAVCLFVLLPLFGGAAIWWVPTVSEVLTLFVTIAFLARHKL